MWTQGFAVKQEDRRAAEADCIDAVGQGVGVESPQWTIGGATSCRHPGQTEQGQIRRVWPQRLGAVDCHGEAALELLGVSVACSGFAQCCGCFRP